VCDADARLRTAITGPFGLALGWQSDRPRAASTISRTEKANVSGHPLPTMVRVTQWTRSVGPGTSEKRSRSRSEPDPTVIRIKGSAQLAVGRRRRNPRPRIADAHGLERGDGQLAAAETVRSNRPCSRGSTARAERTDLLEGGLPCWNTARSWTYGAAVHAARVWSRRSSVGCGRVGKCQPLNTRRGDEETVVMSRCRAPRTSGWRRADRKDRWRAYAGRADVGTQQRPCVTTDECGASGSLG